MITKMTIRMKNIKVKSLKKEFAIISNSMENVNLKINADFLMIFKENKKMKLKQMMIMKMKKNNQILLANRQFAKILVNLDLVNLEINANFFMMEFNKMKMG